MFICSDLLMLDGSVREPGMHQTARPFIAVQNKHGSAAAGCRGHVRGCPQSPVEKDRQAQKDGGEARGEREAERATQACCKPTQNQEGRGRKDAETETPRGGRRGGKLSNQRVEKSVRERKKKKKGRIEGG